MSNTKDIVHLLPLNCQGLGDRHKRGRLIQYLTQQNIDIAFQQETHFTPNLLLTKFSYWHLYNSFGESNSRGCTILINKSLNFKVIDKVQDRNGRYILLNIEMQNNLFSLLNTYAPNDKRARDSFLIGIDTILTEQSNGIKILGGDFKQYRYNITVTKTK